MDKYIAAYTRKVCYRLVKSLNFRLVIAKFGSIRELHNCRLFYLLILAN